VSWLDLYMLRQSAINRVCLIKTDVHKNATVVQIYSVSDFVLAM